MNDLMTALAKRSEWFERQADASGDSDVLDITKFLDFMRGSAAIEKDGSRANFCDPGSEVKSTDGNKATATFRISTVNKDRMGDVMIPQGARKYLDRFRANPCVFFGHRSNELSIGSAWDADHNLELSIHDDSCIDSTVKFHLLTLESEQVFRMVEARELRTASIGFIPHMARVYRREESPAEQDKPKNEIDFSPWRSYQFDVWELYEWSIVSIPMNAECYRMRLSRGLGGKPLAKGLIDYLQPLAERPRQLVTGGFGPSENPMADVKTFTPEQVAHMQEQLSNLISKTYAAAYADAAKALAPVKKEGPQLGEPSMSDPHLVPHGVKFLKALHGHHKAVMSHIKAHLPLLEKEHVIKLAHKHHEIAEKCTGQICEIIGEHYPDHKEHFKSLGDFEIPNVSDLSPADAAEMAELMKLLSTLGDAMSKNDQALKAVTGKVE